MVEPEVCTNCGVVGLLVSTSDKVRGHQELCRECLGLMFSTAEAGRIFDRVHG